MKRILLMMAITLCAVRAQADDYTLFNPVPDDKQRPMNPERPTKTDGATTVDAGHVLIETSFINQVRDKDCGGGNCVRTSEWDAFVPTAFRVGLTQSTEVQFIVSPYQHVATRDDAAGKQSATGFGDTVVRLKHNFWGDDSGDTALAVIPFIKLPTNEHGLGNNDVEGGVELPFSINFDGGWNLNPMTQVNFLMSPDGSGYFLQYVNSVAFTKNFTERFSGYTELYSSRADTGGGWQNTLDFGVVYALTDNVTVDTGVNIGVTKAADDLNWFLGGSFRF